MMKSTHSLRRGVGNAVLVAAVAAVTSAAVLIPWISPVSAAPVGAAPMSAANVPVPNYTWPKYGFDAADQGVSSDPSISTANASQLGVKWMVPDQTQAEASPIVAYNPTLNENVVYQGNIDGGFTAFNATTGAIIWSVNLGSAVISTPLVTAGGVWVDRSFSPYLYKLNAATGALECKSDSMPSFTYSTPTAATPPGGQETIFLGINGINPEAPTYAISAATCATEWKWTAYNIGDAGTWDPTSYAVDANGVGLLMFGSDNPDGTIYAVNALTGKTVWFYKGNGGDIGTAAATTAPGVNGFADGAAYVSNNSGHTYALDLTTGAPYWSFDYKTYTGSGPGRGSAAIVGNHVIVPGPTGVVALNAQTGVPVWNWVGPAPSDSSAAVVGPSGQQVVAVTDLAGNLDVLDAQTGALLYHYNTGGYGVTSVAESNGNFYVATGSGFLYDFAVGGSVPGSPTPTTTITSPANGSSLANPAGNLTISGTTAGTPIASVDVAIQSGGTTGPWWDAATGQWNNGFVDDPATLTPTGWTASFPVPPSGGTYSVLASATGTDGLADIAAYSSNPSSSRTAFTVGHLPSAPRLAITSGAYWVAPGTSQAVTGSGFSAGESVNIALGSTTLATATATSQGKISGAVVIPKTDVFGVSALVATGATSGRSASAAVDISNQWQSSGSGSLHTGYAPNDLTWDLHIVGSQTQFLTQAWSYPSGSPIDTSPAVVQDVAYFADTAGTLTALDVQNSTPIWTHSAGSKVDSSVAVASGLVIFGTTAGSIDALSAATGALVWQTPTSSAVESSPSVAGSTVFVGSDDGTVYALNQTTGAVTWSVRMAGAVMGSPTVDPASGELVVGDSAGRITALSTTTGATLWSVSTGGAVTATPTISHGVVLVGSQSGIVYALNEATGTSLWTYDTGGSVSVGGAYWQQAEGSGPIYVVGNANGDVDFLRIPSGVLLRKLNQGNSPVTGVTAALDFAVVTLANGLVFSNKFPGEYAWEFQSTASLSPVTLLNGVAYVAGMDGTVHAFTVPGNQIP
jgi:outer membrane protein assembly factor BamB